MHPNISPCSKSIQISTWASYVITLDFLSISFLCSYSKASQELSHKPGEEQLLQTSSWCPPYIINETKDLPKSRMSNACLEEIYFSRLTSRKKRESIFDIHMFLIYTDRFCFQQSRRLYLPFIIYYFSKSCTLSLFYVDIRCLWETLAEKKSVVEKFPKTWQKNDPVSSKYW